MTKNRLEADPTISERTNMSVDNIMNLLEFVQPFRRRWHFLQTNFRLPNGFACERNFNKFSYGTRRRETLNTAPHPPKWQYRYVDDSHVCIVREPILQSSTPTLTQLMHVSDLQWKKKKADPSHFWTPRQQGILMEL